MTWDSEARSDRAVWPLSLYSLALEGAVSLAALWRGHVVRDGSLLPTATWLSLGGDPPPRHPQVFQDCSPSQQLGCSLVRSLSQNPSAKTLADS